MYYSYCAYPAGAHCPDPFGSVNNCSGSTLTAPPYDKTPIFLNNSQVQLCFLSQFYHYKKMRTTPKAISESKGHSTSGVKCPLCPLNRRPALRLKASAEQIIHNDLRTDHAAIFILLYAIRCYHCDLYGLLRFCCCSEDFSFASQLFLIVFIYSKLVLRVLDLAEIDRLLYLRCRLLPTMTLLTGQLQYRFSA